MLVFYYWRFIIGVLLLEYGIEISIIQILHLMRKRVNTRRRKSHNANVMHLYHRTSPECSFELGILSIGLNEPWLSAS